MNKADLYRKLYDLQDLKYRDMQIKIIPTVEPESVIGVRTPELKSIAKDILKDGNYKGGFLKNCRIGTLKKTSCRLLSSPG